MGAVFSLLKAKFDVTGFTVSVRQIASFRNRSADRVKVLFWDGNGLVVYAKRLERGIFCFPVAGQTAITVSSTELMELLAGRSSK